MTEETLFAAALGKPTPAERAAFLDQACSGDEALRRRIEGLLESHEHAEFLRTPALKRAAEILASVAATRVEPHGDEDATCLDFLAPSEKPESLGRLGHYEVQEVIGRGGMGVVLRAFDEKLQRVVAIKVMAAQLASNASACARFTREARAAAAVTHDHIVTIHAVEETNGLPYLVMQYVAGSSLQELLTRGGPLEPGEVLRIGLELASGLAAAHAQGLIHRDVKPANILLENSGRVKITDFGLVGFIRKIPADEAPTETARACDTQPDELTGAGIVMGTPDYIAPEQAVDAHAADGRADIYSLGCTLYHLLAGQVPFPDAGTVRKIAAHCERAPRALTEFRSDLPPKLVQVIERMMAKDPAQRYQTATEVMEALTPLASRADGAGQWSRRRFLRRAIVATGILGGGLGAYFCVRGILPPSSGPRTPVVPEPAPVRIGEIRRFGPKMGFIWRVAISTDGQLALSAGNDGHLRLWNLDTCLEVRAIKTPGGVNGLALSTDARRALSCGPDRIIRLWDLDRGEELGRFEGHKHTICNVAFLPGEQRFLSVDDKEKYLREWDVKSEQELRRIEVPAAPPGRVGFALSADGRRVLTVLTNTLGQQVQLWDLQSGAQVVRLKGHSNQVECMTFSADDRQALTGSRDGTARLWNLETGEEVRVFHGHTHWVTAVALSRDGRRMLSGSWDRTCRLWDAATGEELHRFFGQLGIINCVAFTPDGRRALSGGLSGEAGVDATLRLWQLPP